MNLESVTNESSLLRIVLDTPNDTHMFCASNHKVVVKGARGKRDTKKASDLEVGDCIRGEGDVVYTEKI